MAIPGAMFPALQSLTAPGGAAGPSAAGGTTTSVFDSSGWNVNFGEGRISSSAGGVGDLGQYVPFVLAGVGLLVVWRLTRRKR